MRLASRVVTVKGLGLRFGWSKIFCLLQPSAFTKSDAREGHVCSNRPCVYFRPSSTNPSSSNSPTPIEPNSPSYPRPTSRCPLPCACPDFFLGAVLLINYVLPLSVGGGQWECCDYSSFPPSHPHCCWLCVGPAKRRKNSQFTRIGPFISTTFCFAPLKVLVGDRGNLIANWLKNEEFYVEYFVRDFAVAETNQPGTPVRFCIAAGHVFCSVICADSVCLLQRPTIKGGFCDEWIGSTEEFETK